MRDMATNNYKEDRYIPMSEQTTTTDAFETLYLERRKKSQLLIIAVVILAIATAGSLAWGLSNNASNPSNMPGNFQGQGFGGQGGPGSMRGGMNMDVTQFFNNDGSVNHDEVDSFLSRMPSGNGNAGFNFLDRFTDMINQAADDGDITQSQADALIQAFESGSESNET